MKHPILFLTLSFLFSTLTFSQQTSDKIIDIDSVTVRPKNIFLSEEGGVTKVSPSILTQVPGSIRDPLRMLPMIAGVQNVGDERNDLVVRGNTPIGINWYMNGIEIFNPNHYSFSGNSGGVVSTLNADMLGTGLFYKGAFPAQYGNVLSGIYDMSLRTGSSQFFRHSAYVSNLDVNVNSEGYFYRKSKSSYIVGLRVSNIALIDKIYSGYRELLGGIPNLYDGSFQLNFPFSSGTLSIWGIGGDSNIDINAKNGINTSFLNIKNHTFNASAGINFDTKISDKLECNVRCVSSFLNVSNDGKHFYYTGEGGLPVEIFEDREKKVAIMTQIQYEPIKSLVWKTGITANLQSSMVINDERQYPEDSLFYYDYKKSYVLINAFSTLSYRFKNFRFDGGLHYFHFVMNNRFSIEPRLGVNYYIYKNHTVTFNYGEYSKLLPIGVYLLGKRNIDHETFDIFYYQPYFNMDFMRSRQYNISYFAQITDKAALKIEGFYHHHYKISVSDGNGKVSLLNAGYSFTNIYPQIQSLESTGKGRNYGVEMTIDIGAYKGFSLMWTGTFYDAKATDTKGDWYNTVFNGHYATQLLLGQSIKINNKSSLELNLMGVLQGGRRYTPIDVEESIATNSIKYDDNQYLGKQYKPYFRTDFKISWLYQSANHIHIVGLDIRNIFNYKNIYFQTERLSNNEIVEKYTIYQLPIFPVFSYKWVFSHGHKK